MKDIFYKQGAGGVDFHLTLKDSEKILSKPLMEQKVGNDIHTVYKSGLYIIWSADRPQVPRVILVGKQYRGSLNTGDKLGKLKIGQDLSKFYNDKDAYGQEFLRVLYNELENKEETYNCIEQKECALTAYPKGIIYNLKNILLTVSTDRKILSEFRLLNNPSLNNLEPKYDVISGSFKIQDDKLISHGQSWKEAHDILGIDGLNRIAHDKFGKNFGSITLGLTKAKYDRAYEAPTESEKIKMTYVGSGYLEPLKFNEQYIDADSFYFQSNLPKNALTLETVFANKDIKEVAKKISGALKDRLQSKYPNRRILSNIFGLHGKNFAKNLAISALAIDEKEGQAKMVATALSTYDKKLSHFMTNTIKPSVLNKIVIPHFTKDLDFKNVDVMTSLTGIEIGKSLVVTEADIARSEATAIYNFNNGTGEKERLLFRYSDSLEGIFDETGRILKYEVTSLFLNDFNVYLDVVLSPNPMGTHKIVGIGTGEFYGKLNNLCSSSLLNFKKGESSESIQKKIHQFKMTQKEEAKECAIYSIKSGDGQDVISKIYFPKHRLVLNFAQRELANIYIYTNPEEVQ